MCVCVCVQSCWFLCTVVEDLFSFGLLGQVWQLCVCVLWMNTVHVAHIEHEYNVKVQLQNISSVSAVKSSKEYTRGSVVMVDEMINSSPAHYRFPEAGLRIMITNHFGPKTRLRMASRLIINEVRKYTYWVNGYIWSIQWKSVLFWILLSTVIWTKTHPLHNLQ